MSQQEQAAQAAHKISQILGEVLIHHAPQTADINEQAKYRHLEAFLEDLEQHTSSAITPFLTKVLESGALPGELAGLVEEALTTPAQFSAIITQLFLYGIVGQLVGTSITPYLVAVSNTLNAKAVGEGIATPVSPAVIATAAARGLNLGDPPTVNMPEWAYAEAAKSGVGADDINLQASIVGTPPAPQELFELYRRGVIDLDLVKTGLAEGDTRDDWIDQLVQLVVGWLTPLDFVRAAVQSQMTYEDAQAWAGKTGLDTKTQLPIDTGSGEATPDMFGLAFSIAGRPPGPQELARAANRGLIDWTGTGADALTFQQGIAESDVKTKWTGVLQKLAVYFPPPEQTGTLLERGAIDQDTAVSYWEAAGVPTALAKGYAYVAQQQHIGQDKLLAKGEVLTAYYDQLISKDEATDYLADLGFVGDVAAQILAIQDFKREMTAINAVVRRISNLYAAYKLSATDAQNALQDVGLSQDQAYSILQTWDTVRERPIRLPTAEQIGKAVQYGTLTQEQGLAELEALGYQDRDAAIVLSAGAEAQVTPLPAAGTGVGG